jgi:TRAP-type C4-dicarboxylate transport system permease small subunit
MLNVSKAMKAIDQVVRAIDQVVIILGIISVLAMASFLFFGVISRYIFEETFSVVEDLSVNLSIWAVMLFGGPTFLRGGHVGMDFFAEKLHGSRKAVHQLVISISLIFLSAIFFWKGVEIVSLILQSGKTTPSGELKEWYLKMSIPIGSGLLLFFALGEMIKNLCLLLDPNLAKQVFPARAKGHQGQEGLL